MNKYLVLVGATLFFAACTNDNSASDNENGPDELTPADHTAVADDTVTVDDAVTDDDQTDPTDQSDPTDQPDNSATDDIATDDIVTDETADAGDDGDTVVETPDADFDPAVAIACCVEVVKEWWRCPAEIADPYTPGYTTEKADACIACVSGLAACADFLPLDAGWACASVCNDLCPPGTVRENDDTVGKGLGQSRRAVAAEYCAWMVDTACSYEPGDFTGLGSTEPLNACF